MENKLNCRRLSGKLPKILGILWSRHLKHFLNEAIAVKYQKYCSRPEVFCKRGVLKNFVKSTVKHLCKCFFWIRDSRDSSAGFSCEFWEIFKRIYFVEHPRTPASEMYALLILISWKSFGKQFHIHQYFCCIFIEIQCITKHEDFHAVVLLKNLLWQLWLGLMIVKLEAYGQGIQFLTSNRSFSIFMLLVILQEWPQFQNQYNEVLFETKHSCETLMSAYGTEF